MRLSQYFLPVLKEIPAEAQVVSHQLMLRSGMIAQSSSGIYTWLPLGLKVLKKIANIVRDEHEKAGCVEILMPTIQSADLWKETGRYDSFGKEMLRIRDRHDREMLYGPTNEEVVTDIFRSFVKSYKSLPMCLFHIQWKFRDEIRPRFGVMRGREFLMKDAYSFDITAEDAQRTYEKMYQTYVKIFKRLGLKTVAVRADSGAIGGDLSHEFHVLADTGESTIFYDPALETIPVEDMTMDRLRQIYASEESMHDAKHCPVPEHQLAKAKGIEVGHVFYLGRKYSESMNARITNDQGHMIPAEMGCYGIGVSRLVAAIIEAYHDELGMIWPTSVAPFDVGLINLAVGHEECDPLAATLYQSMKEFGLDVLFDDRDDRAGVKFATMDLIGLPWQVIIGPKMAAEKRVELKHRMSGDKHIVSASEVIPMLRDIHIKNAA